MAKPAFARLIDAGIENFSKFGLFGASTRLISAAAGCPMSAITYHFGGKSGLYKACFDKMIASNITCYLSKSVAFNAVISSDFDQSRAYEILKYAENIYDALINLRDERSRGFIKWEIACPTGALLCRPSGEKHEFTENMCLKLKEYFRGNVTEPLLLIKCNTILYQVYALYVAYPEKSSISKMIDYNRKVIIHHKKALNSIIYDYLSQRLLTEM